jgi:hypothetical protein
LLDGALLKKDVLDEPTEELVGDPKIDADDQAGDENDDRALDQLLLTGPLDLLQLAPGLTDEAAAGKLALAAAVRAGGLDCGADRRAGAGAALEGGLALSLGGAAGSALGAGLAGHQRVSRCTVWRPHQRQYFLNSIRSGEFRFDFWVW